MILAVLDGNLVCSYNVYYWHIFNNHPNYGCKSLEYSQNFRSITVSGLPYLMKNPHFDAVALVLGAMRKASLIEGLFRRDIPEYPRRPSAKQHRQRRCTPGLQRHSCGAATSRSACSRTDWKLESPGGLFGNVTIDNIEHQHSTRNARLMRMMEDLHLVENRGTGIKVMLQSLREASLEPPKFEDARNSFRVKFFNHTLMNPEAIRWLKQFVDYPINDRQRLALVYLRQQGNQEMTNGDYRRLNHVDPLVRWAGAEV